MVDFFAMYDDPLEIEGEIALHKKKFTDYTYKNAHM